MAATKTYHPRAVVDPPRANHPLRAYAEMVVAKMTNNAYFPSPGTVVTDLEAAAKAFGGALADSRNLKDVAEALAAAKRGVVDCLFHVKDLVNAVAEKAPPDLALAIIESSGLRARKVVVRTKLPLEVKWGGLEGVVLLFALAAAKSAMYFFEYSTDKESWVPFAQIMKTTTTLAGLTAGTLYYFRVRAQTRKGLGDWTQPVPFRAR
jgi:hypothetical protein